MKIATTCECPPIPIRHFDWAAYDSDTYCGCGECRSPVGRGATEREAVADLLDQFSDTQRADLSEALRDETRELKRRLRISPDCPVVEKLAAERRISENEQMIVTLETGV